MITERPYVDSGGKLFCYALAEGAWVIGGAISNGGIVVRWGGDTFGADFVDAPGGNPDGMLLELAREVPIGADGLIMLPFLIAERAPLWNPTIPGAFLGVRRSHRREHFVRAAVEGVAMMLSTVVDDLDRVTPIRQVRATGGVFRSTVWRDVLAAALGKPLVVTDGAEGTALGAAALALYGLGQVTSFAMAWSNWARIPPGLRRAGSQSRRRRRLPGRSARIPGLLASYDEVRTLFS